MGDIYTLLGGVLLSEKKGSKFAGVGVEGDNVKKKMDLELELLSVCRGKTWNQTWTSFAVNSFAADERANEHRAGVGQMRLLTGNVGALPRPEDKRAKHLKLACNKKNNRGGAPV